MKPRLLDLFCGAGGASMGYQRAGFEVVGVDIRPQPNYPFKFHQWDALEFLQAVIESNDDDSRLEFDAIHASPPCQAFTAYRRKGHGVGDSASNLIAQTRELLRATGRPYVIENVPGAPLRDPVLLCGSQFVLDVQRHRLFETNWDLEPHWCPCRHKLWADDRYPGATNRNGRRTVEIGVWRIPLEVQREAMDITWMTLEELSEAIPPAYTEFIGHQLMQHVQAKAVA